MHTVEQAKSLWCPLVRTARRESEKPYNPHSKASQGDTFVVGGCNTDALEGTRIPLSCRCIGDACAMWRWGEFTTVSRDEVVADQSLGPGGKRVIQVASSVPVAGYCGLAGRPEVAP